MKRIASLSLAVASLLALFAAAPAMAESRPRYGGTLRIQMRDPVTSIDPSDATTRSRGKDQLIQAIFDRLTGLDDKGRAQPQLAIRWQADAAMRVWQFTLRNDVHFTDGSALTLNDVVQTLAAADTSWKVHTGVNGDVVVIECATSEPSLPIRLAQPRYSVFKKNADGSLLGTGAFTVTDFQPGKKITLAANDSYWAGRPYLDGIEVWMNISLGELLRDRRLDRDDAVEAPLDQVRPLQQAGQRLVLSAPTELL